MKADDISGLVQLAYQYGPFFFSVLFVVFVTGWAHKRFREVSDRTPPAAPADLATYRIEFVVSWAIGIALVAASVAWWFAHPPGVYVFRGVVRNLKAYETLDPAIPDVYFRSVLRPVFAGDETQFRNERFIALQLNKPFKRGQTIPVDFVKGKEKRLTLEIEYSGDEEEPAYVIAWDEKSQKNVLSRVSSSPAHAGLVRIFPEAHAQEAAEPSLRVERAQGVVRAAPSDTYNPRYGHIIKNLQDPYTDVGTKIVSVEELQGLDTGEKRDVLLTRTSKESMLVTLFDLTRHSDAELASKARSALAQFDFREYLAGELRSPVKARREAASDILFRLDRSQAAEVLKQAGAERDPALRNLASQAASDDNFQTVRPSGSARGDQYYVKATWDPKSPEVVACLTRLFNQALISKRSLQDEVALMAGRSQRIVYWYEKEWAIGIAHDIEKCGGRARFINP